jgi:hypothetical protein
MPPLHFPGHRRLIENPHKHRSYLRYSRRARSRRRAIHCCHPSRQLPCRRVSATIPPPFSSSPPHFPILNHFLVTSSVASRISCSVVMTSPRKTLRKLCFTYGGINQCAWLASSIITLCTHKTTCLVIIPNWALPSHCIPLKFCSTWVGPTCLVLLFFTKKNIALPGLSLIYLGQRQKGMEELEDAASQKATEEHSVIDEAIRDGGEGYTVFSIVRLVSPCFRLKIVDWICSPLVSSTVRPRTSSRMPRPATF